MCVSTTMFSFSLAADAVGDVWQNVFHSVEALKVISWPCNFDSWPLNCEYSRHVLCPSLKAVWSLSNCDSWLWAHNLRTKFELPHHLLTHRKGKWGFNVQFTSWLNQFVYHTNQTKKMKREKQNKKKWWAIKSRNGRKNLEIRPKRWGRILREGLMEKVSFESGLERRWSDA